MSGADLLISGQEQQNQNNGRRNAGIKTAGNSIIKDGKTITEILEGYPYKLESIFPVVLINILKTNAILIVTSLFLKLLLYVPG